MEICQRRSKVCPQPDRHLPPIASDSLPPVRRKTKPCCLPGGQRRCLPQNQWQFPDPWQCTRTVLPVRCMCRSPGNRRTGRLYLTPALYSHFQSVRWHWLPGHFGRHVGRRPCFVPGQCGPFLLRGPLFLRPLKWQCRYNPLSLIHI